MMLSFLEKTSWYVSSAAIILGAGFIGLMLF